MSQHMSGQAHFGGEYHSYAGLFLKQKYAMVANKYWVHTIDSAGGVGPVVAFAEQKKMKLREEVTFFTDESKSAVAFTFKSRNVIDMSATTDVKDARGDVVGTFRKDAMKSLLNSTWHLEAPGVSAVGRERNQTVAIVRRFGGMIPLAGDLLDMVPWQFHFDFVASSGENVMSVERQKGLRDQYRVWLPPVVGGAPLDWRLGAAMGVALDAFQGR